MTRSDRATAPDSDAASSWILVLEDNAGDAVLAERYLGQFVEEVRWVTSVDDGLLVLHGALRNNHLPRMVLVDINLPGRSGHEFFVAVRRIDGLRHLPLVGFSSSEDPGEARRASAAGANAFVIKRSDIRELREALLATGHFWVNIARPIQPEVELERKPLTVVLIEDSTADRLLVRRHLERSSLFDAMLFEAVRLADGLALIEAQEPDVVLLDLNLPDSRGLESIRPVLEQSPSVGLLVISGADTPALRRGAGRAGARAFLEKSAMSTEQLSLAVQRAMLPPAYGSSGPHERP